MSATALAHYTEAHDAAEREHNKDVQELLKPPFSAELILRIVEENASIKGRVELSDVVPVAGTGPDPDAGLFGASASASNLA